MAPSSSKQKTVPSKLSAAKSKAMQPAPAPAAALSHSSKDHFDEDAEMKKLEERMMKKGEAAPKMVATPQKAPRSAHELSPAPEGGSKSRVRCKPATPSKVATPVKSPDPKKSKTVAPDVVLEVPDDSQGPAAGDEVGSVPKDGSMVEPSTGTCEHGKQGEQISGSEDTPMEDAGECKPTLMSNGSNGSAELRRIDTTTTVPDIGLECHLFMQQLVGDHDVEARERLHIQISHWFEKMRSWYAEEGDIWVSRLDPVLKPHCESLVVLLNEKDAQMANLHLAQLDEKPKIDEVEKGYKTMLAKLPEIIKKNNEDPKSLDSRTFSLLQWKSGKMDSIKSAGKKLEAELSSLSLKIRACMDLLIDAVQKADNVDECMEVQTDQQVPEKNDDDVIMTELEALMAQCVVSNGPDVGDSFLREPTLVLGQGDTGANQQDAPMESMPQDAQTPPSQEPVVEPSQTVATLGADSAQLSPEEAALKHLQDMEDGPLKSSLLALVSQGGARPAPSSNTPSAPAAAETAMRRQDTTQLQAQHHAVDADAIPQPDGTFLYRGPKGRLETWAEREYRLAHNQKMCFNRSFRNAPDEVVRASANRKYNRDLLALLYEDWLSSGQCWAKSATYLNAIRSKEGRKRGTFVMRDKTWLIEKYTEPVAKDIMQDKRAKQSARKTHDPIYVMDNPDLPGSEEHQLFRVFDSLSFEDEETNRFESGINTTGEFSEEQSKELMPVILAGAKESGLFGGGDESQNLQTPGVGNKGAGKGKPGASTTLKPQKPKKVAGMKKQVQSKISVISTKLTDLKVLRNKVDNSPLSAGMTTGYIAELDARDSELQASKLELETLYMVEKDDSEIESDPVTKDQFQKALDSVDQLLPSYNTTIRSVKMAIDPPKPKAKGKAKAAAKKE